MSGKYAVYSAEFKDRAGIGKYDMENGKEKACAHFKKFLMK